MDFALIGSARTYAKMVNLKFAAKYRLKTGQSLVNSNGTLNFSTLGKRSSSFVDKMMSAQKQTADAATKRRLAAIKKKLLNGKKLSNEEMGFLLKNDSKLYNKAKKAEEAREELKAALGRAKTKKEAREALMHAMMKASAECSAELDAAKSGGMSSFSGGGDAGMSVAISGDGGGVIDAGGFSAQSLSVGNVSEQSNASAENNASTASNVSATNNESANKNDAAENNFANGIKGSQSSSEKDTPDDILEKFIMIIRALEDEWAQFSKSKQYKDLPDDGDDPLFDRRKANVISRYRAAMNYSLAED